MMLLPLVFFAAAATAAAPTVPTANAPIGISVTISRYNDPLLRRPLDPDVVPLKCEALIYSTAATNPRLVMADLSVTLIAGEKRSTKPSVQPGRIELTCDVAPDGHSAKTKVTVYHEGNVVAQQMTDIWLPEVKRH